jgi:hypothetical protein
MENSHEFHVIQFLCFSCQYQPGDAPRCYVALRMGHLSARYGVGMSGVCCISDQLHVNHSSPTCAHQ